MPSLAAALVLPYEYFWVSIAPVKASPRASGLWNGAFYQAAFFSLALGVAIVAVVTTVVVVNLLRLRTPVPSDGDRALHAQRARSMVVIASEACSAPKVSIS